jgi:hypothetical protein
MENLLRKEEVLDNRNGRGIYVGEPFLFPPKKNTSNILI